jgi:hypothetical protein
MNIKLSENRKLPSIIDVHVSISINISINMHANVNVDMIQYNITHIVLNIEET